MPFLIKDWREMYRSKILISSFFLILFISLIIVYQVLSYSSKLSFPQIFVPLFKANIYFVPLLSMILSSFSIQQERLQKTIPILLTRYVTPVQFLWWKSITAHIIMCFVLMISYFLVFVFSKFFVQVSFWPFFYFLLSLLFLAMIFNQIGSFLGCITENRLQLLSYILIIWFFFLFIYDLILIYVVPHIQSSDVFVFSIFYFLSPINTMRYFLYVGLDVYNLDSFSGLFDHITFHSPILVLSLNLILYLGGFFVLGLFVLKNGGLKE